MQPEPAHALPARDPPLPWSLAAAPRAEGPQQQGRLLQASSQAARTGLGSVEPCAPSLPEAKTIGCLRGWCKSWKLP